MEFFANTSVICIHQFTGYMPDGVNYHSFFVFVSDDKADEK